MLTRKALNLLIISILAELERSNIIPHKMLLFGSYAKGMPHQNSDLDLAIWHPAFSGNWYEDIELVMPILRNQKFKIDFKFFPADATAENFDPFIEEIESHAIEWDIEKRCFKPNEIVV